MKIFKHLEPINMVLSSYVRVSKRVGCFCLLLFVVCFWLVFFFFVFVFLFCFVCLFLLLSRTTVIGSLTYETILYVRI